MKKMTCSQMGGPCEAEVMGATAEELAANGMKHLEEAHPEIAAKMKEMSPEENDKWMEDFKQKFDAAPETE